MDKNLIVRLAIIAAIVFMLSQLPATYERWLIWTTEIQPTLSDKYATQVWYGWTIIAPWEENWITEDTELVGLKTAKKIDLKKAINMSSLDGPTLITTPQGIFFMNPNTKTVVLSYDILVWIATENTDEYQLEMLSTPEDGNMGFLLRRNGRLVLMNYNLAPKQ